MAFAANIFHQNDFAGADFPSLTVAGGNLHATVQVDDVLPARGRMPAQIIIAAGFAEDDPGGREPGGQFAAVTLLNPGNLDIAPVRFPRIIDVDIVNSHRHSPYSIGTKIECRI